MSKPAAYRWPTAPLRRGTVSIVDGPFGSNLASEHYVDEGARVVRLGNIGAMTFRERDRAFISLQHFQTLRRHEVIAGDILVAGLGDETNQLGRAAIAPADLGPALVKADCFRLRVDTTLLSPRYVAWYLNSPLAAYLVSNESRGATRVRATPDAILAIDIPYPPLDVQQRIAALLDDQVARLDLALAVRRRQLDLLSETAKAFVYGEVTGEGRAGRSRGSRVPWAPRIPSHWGDPRLNQVAKIGTGHTPSKSEPSYWIDCDIPWLTTADVHRFRHDNIDFIDEPEHMISQRGLANSSAVIHPSGTVALCRTSGSAGFSIIMGRPMATSQDFATWTCGPLLNHEYLLWCLRAMRSDLMGRLAIGSTHKTIYFPDLLSIRVPLPPLAEQDAAVQSIRAVAQSVRAAQEAIGTSTDQIAELKQSLISAAVMGDFDVSAASSPAVPA